MIPLYLLKYYVTIHKPALTFVSCNPQHWIQKNQSNTPKQNKILQFFKRIGNWLLTPVFPPKYYELLNKHAHLTVMSHNSHKFLNHKNLNFSFR